MSGDPIDALISRVLDYSMQRHRVLSNNLSNLNTPGYKRLDFDFGEELAQAVKSEGARGIEKLELEVKTDETAVARADGNSVLLEREMAEISKNSFLYQSVIQMLSRRTAIMRTAITGRS